MNDTLVLLTGLYEDQQLLCDVWLSTTGSDLPEGGVAESVVNTAECISLEPAAMSSADWDVLVEKILVAERVLTV